MKFIDWITDYRFKVFNNHWWKDFWYRQISTRIWPRQKWLINKIPRQYMDKDSLIEICVMECIKTFVEEELGKEWLFNPNRWEGQSNVPENQIQFENEIKDQYILLTETLPQLEKDLEIAWDTIPNYYEKTFKGINALEKKIDDLKTELMVWAVKNRQCMWT
jgi:hypothetical protein